jgi:hypothetical protein
VQGIGQNKEFNMEHVTKSNAMRKHRKGQAHGKRADTT